MNDLLDKSCLPYTTWEPTGPRRHAVRALRVAAYVALAAMLIAPIIQFQSSLKRNMTKYAAWEAAGAAGQAPKGHKGAVTRWQGVVRMFWEHRNIYKANPGSGEARLHPNMPFVVILLTPFAYMPPMWAALTFNVLKVLVVVASILGVARLAAHGNRRVPDWVIALGVAWAAPMLIGDIQHGNTNTFVLGAIVLHLWLHRRGWDLPAGAALAIAICLKFTPALFLLYWAYQRNWRLLASTAAAGVIFVVGVPELAVGPDHTWTLLHTYVTELILPASAGGQWYPNHMNQSLSGVMSRYFLAGPEGDIFWHVDDHIYGQHFERGWIAVVSLRPAAARGLLRLAQLGVLALTMWSIGFKRLDRTDGRRLLHYGLVVVGMMLLNQRTWDHHATVLLIAQVGLWHAIAYGRMSRRGRIAALVLALAAGAILIASRGDSVESVAMLAGQTDDAAEHTRNIVEAYGPACAYFLLTLTALVICSRCLKGRSDPYANERQRVLRRSLSENRQAVASDR